MRRRRTLIFVVIAIAAFLLLSYVFGPFGGPPPETDTADITKVGPAPKPPPPADTSLPPSVAGLVVDEEGKALRGVSVTIVTLQDGKRHEANVRTDAEGRYEERTLPGGEVVFVEAVKAGYPAFRLRPEGVHILPAETVTLDIAMPETFHLNGHVKSRDGKIVAGARVSFGNWQTLTDERGKFRLDGIPSNILRKGTVPTRLVTTAVGYVDDTKDLGLDRAHSYPDDIEVILEER